MSTFSHVNDATFWILRQFPPSHAALNSINSTLSLSIVEDRSPDEVYERYSSLVPSPGTLKAHHRVLCTEPFFIRSVDFWYDTGPVNFDPLIFFIYLAPRTKFHETKNFSPH